MPLWPCLLNFQREPRSLLFWFLDALPLSADNFGLGSNVSICEGPPRIQRKITLLARAGKCGFLAPSGPEGFISFVSFDAACAAIPWSAV